MSKRLYIYKKHLDEIKLKNTSKDWSDIGKKIFVEVKDDIMKHKIMIWLAGFKFMSHEQGIYYYSIPPYAEKYIGFYESLFSQLKSVKISLLVNKNT